MCSRTFFALLGSAAAFLFGGSPANAAPASPQPNPSALVRGAYLADTSAVDVYLSDAAGGKPTLALSRVRYGDVSEYQRIKPGRYTVGLRPAGADVATRPTLSWTLDAKPGLAFTVLAIGTQKALTGRVLSDDLTPLPAGRARVRVIQAAKRAKTVNVTAANGLVLAAKVPFSATTEYTSVPAGSWPVTTRSVDQREITTTKSLTLRAGATDTVVVLDGAQQSSISMRVVDDSIGVNLPPLGPAATGDSAAPMPDIRSSEARQVAIWGLGVVLISAAAAVVIGCRPSPHHPVSIRRHHGSRSRARALRVAALIAAGAVLSGSAHIVPDRPAATPSPIDLAAAVVGPVPVRIAIPSIGVDTELEALHRGVDGALKSPEKEDAGWYADGVVPGERGPAVILGHVDSARDGSAVFRQLSRLHSGDIVMLDTSNHDTEYFVVDTVRQSAESSFPTGLVYGPTAMPELRLITCTGSFDTSEHSYCDNLIVTAFSVWTRQL